MMIVGRKAITEMSSLLQNSSNLITINISEKSFSMINENYIYNSKIIDGSWPKYLGLLPNPNTYLGSFTIEKDILKNLINNVSFLSTENLNSWVTIIVDNNKITLKNSNSKHEYAEVTSNDVIYDGEHHEMTLNYKFLTDIINNVSSKELIVNIVKSSVEIELKDNEKDCGELKYIIMLIRL
jgi:DNA polymerase-3 subunit beta